MHHRRPKPLTNHQLRHGFPGWAWAVALLSLLLAVVMGLWLAGATTAPVFVEMRPGDGWRALMAGDPRAITTFAVPAALWLIAVALFHYYEPRRWILREIRRGTFRHTFPQEPEPPPSPPEPPPQYVIPIQRRPFHEALMDDAPELSPSPQLAAIARRLATRDPNDTQEYEEMRLSQMAATAALAVGMAGGCTRAGDGYTEKTEYVHSLPEAPKEYRRNPHPQDAYELTVTVANAPGPLVLFGASASYDAPDCVYSTNRFAGSTGRPRDHVTLDLVQVSKSTWRGTFYRDAMLDEDYDGPQGAMRPCHWRLIDVGAAFTATGVPGETRFVADVGWSNDKPLEKTDVYFIKSLYPAPRDSYGEPYNVSGDTDRSRFNADVADNDLFTVTLTARKVQP